MIKSNFKNGINTVLYAVFLNVRWVHSKAGRVVCEAPAGSLCSREAQKYGIQQLAKVHKPVYKWINAQQQPLKKQTHRL